MSGARLVALLVGVALLTGAAPAAAAPGADAVASAKKKAPKSPLAGKYFWRVLPRADFAWDNYGLYFVDSKWAYRGFPKAGVPVRCTRTTAKRDKQPGCLRYRYSKRTGKLRIGSDRGTYRKGKLRIGFPDKAPWERLKLPRRGARLDVKLTNVGYIGICGAFSFCSIFYKNLAMNKAGRFVLSKSAVTAIDTASGSAMGGSFPPGERGSYRILKRGQIKLSFDDGKVQRQTIGISLNDRGRPDPRREGVVIGDTNFYVDD